MSWIDIILMAIGLAMDCCAVSAVQGLNQHAWHPRALLMALIFGMVPDCYSSILYVHMHPGLPWLCWDSWAAK